MEISNASGIVGITVLVGIAFLISLTTNSKSCLRQLAAGICGAARSHSGFREIEIPLKRERECAIILIRFANDEKISVKVACNLTVSLSNNDLNYLINQISAGLGGKFEFISTYNHHDPTYLTIKPKK